MSWAEARRMWASAKEWEHPQGAGKGKEQISPPPQSLQKENSPVPFLPDSPPELQSFSIIFNKWILFFFLIHSPHWPPSGWEPHYPSMLNTAGGEQ